MTDEEMKRLEEVARSGWMNPDNAAAVLALIQRVRDAEAAADSAMGDMSADLRDAERRGAEEMREAAAMVSLTAEAKTPGMRVGLHVVAGRIRSLPLPGDAQ